MFPVFCSQSIFVRCQFFTWSCLLPIFSVRFLFLRCHFFLIFLFPIFCSQSIFVRCQFFTWSCLLPIFSVRFLFLRCHFFLYLFVSHFLFSVHFCKMRVFHLELFPSQFRSDSFFSGAIFFVFFACHCFVPVHVCQMPVFHCSCLLPIFFPVDARFFVCFPFFGPSPFFYHAIFSLGVVCFRLGRSESFLRKSILYLEPTFSPL